MVDYVLSMDETLYVIHHNKRIPGLKDGSVHRASAAQVGKPSLEPQHPHSQPDATMPCTSTAPALGKEAIELVTQPADQST